MGIFDFKNEKLLAESKNGIEAAMFKFIVNQSMDKTFRLLPYQEQGGPFCIEIREIIKEKTESKKEEKRPPSTPKKTNG